MSRCTFGADVRISAATHKAGWIALVTTAGDQDLTLTAGGAVVGLV
jgi:hypothetical protein